MRQSVSVSLREVPGRGSASTVTLSHTGATERSAAASPFLRAATAAAASRVLPPESASRYSTVCGHPIGHQNVNRGRISA
jgi:hypothetical protein